MKGREGLYRTGTGTGTGTGLHTGTVTVPLIPYGT